MKLSVDQDHNLLVETIRHCPRAVEIRTARFTALDGTSCFYRVWGLPEAGEPTTILVMVHGMVTHSEPFVALADQLLTDRSQLWALDLRGHGRSGGTRGDIPRFMAFVEDVIALLAVVRARHPNATLILGGESMGALVVVLAAMDGAAGVDRLFFLAPAFRPNYLGAFGRDWRFAAAFWSSMALRAHTPSIPSRHEHTFAAPAALAYHTRDPHMLPAYSANYLWKIAQAQDRVAQRGGAAALPYPFMIAHGTADELVSQPASRAFYDAAPDRQNHDYLAVPGAWHCLYLDPAFTAVHARAIQTFLGL
jgi:alpha-beta hydrolase superfamily lysophospholipase